MKRYAVLGIIIALVVSIAAIGCTSSKSTKHKSTPTPTTAVSTPTTEATAEPTETAVANEAATATSLDFTVQVNTQNVSCAYRYRARNIGTTSLDFRYDLTSDQVNAAYILKGSTRQGWVYSGGQWIEFTTMYQDFDHFWDSFYYGFESYHSYLAEEWTGLQGWTYTIPGVGTVTYSNITINPTLSDDIFQPD